MSNAIERDVYVLRNTLKNPISYVRGTDLLPIIFHFRDFTIPSGATATAFTAKPDGNAVYGSATITGNDVTVDVQQQMFIVLGLSMLQVEIKSGEETLATFVQPVMVEPNLKAGDFPDSTTDISFLDDAIEQAQEAVQQANQAVESANTAISGANTAAESANSAAQNANNAAKEIQDKAEAGDFSSTIQVGTTTTLAPGEVATVNNSGTNQEAVLNFGIPKGDPGTAATIQVGTTQTVQPEENAEVNNTGTANAAVLNFKIPRGADGMTDLTAEYKDASEYVCEPTVNAPVVVKELDGKTEQVETTGAQLFDANEFKTYSFNSATVTNNGDGSFTISGSGSLAGVYLIIKTYSHDETLKMIKSGTLNLSCGFQTCPYVEVYLSTSNGNKNYLQNSTDGFSSTEIENETLNDETCKLVVRFYGQAGDTIIPGTIRPMLYQSGDGTWEPYTGGSPAPSSDYLQVIKGVGGMGYFDGTFQSVWYDSSGNPTPNINYYSSDKIECNAGDVIKVEYEQNVDALLLYYWNANGEYISYDSAQNSNIIQKSAPTNTKYFAFSANASNIGNSPAKYCTVTINGEYQTGVEVQGKNWFNIDGNVNIRADDYTQVSTNVVSGDILTCNVNEQTTHAVGQTISGLNSKTVTFSAKVISFGSGIGASIFVYENGGYNNNRAYTEEVNSVIKVTCAISTDNPVFAFTTGNGTGAQFTDIQVEIGETNTDYQPYHHTALTIPLTSPLYEGDKICYVKPGESYVDADGTTVVADRILYGCYRENAVVVFDGSEDENLLYNEVYNQIWTLNTQYNIKNESLPAGIVKSDNFISGSISDRNSGKKEIVYQGSDTAGFLGIASTIFTSLGTAKTWLSTHPTTVLYKLAQPYFEPFSDQSIFYGLRTDDTLSYIYSNDPIEPVLTVEVAKNSTGGYLLESYAQAQKNAISEANSQSRLSAIEQQLVNQATTPTE